MYWSDTHIPSNKNKEMKDFTYKDWVEYYRFHGALIGDLAETMARNRLLETEKGKITASKS